MFWEGMPEEEKISRVGKAGISAIEFWGWKNKDMNKIRAAKDEAGLSVAAFGAQLDTELTACSDAFSLVGGMKKSVEEAKSLDCSRLILTTGNEVDELSFEDTHQRVVNGLKAVAPVVEDAGITLVVEPLNPIVDHRGYWLTKTADAARIVEEVGSANVRILYDIYHQQITEGNVISTINQHLPLIGHFHAAGVPGRHELVGGELDYGNIFSVIGESDYDGFVGLEFSPTKADEEALSEAVACAG
jgi:hydroxypyruvate isomerase